MVLRTRRYWFWVIGLLFVASDTFAQDASRYGIGIFAGLNVPVQGLSQRYTTKQNFGITLDRRLKERTTIEFEYHRSTLDNGKIEDRTFIWSIDRQEYASPDARSEFKLNTFLVNALVRVGQWGNHTGLHFKPYLAVGAGFYDYRDEISGLIYPNQRVEPLDTTFWLEPQIDAHTALGGTVGFGVAALQSSLGFGLDLRARYHFFGGDLRPMEA